MEDEIRIDKWLWAVRIFKTRSLATEACKSGKVKINDNVVKASRDIHEGDVVEVYLPPLRRTVRILKMLDKRMAAKNLIDYIEDLTPPEEYQKLRNRRESAFEFWESGSGRPTKKSRRDIDQLKRFLGQ